MKSNRCSTALEHVFAPIAGSLGIFGSFGTRFCHLGGPVRASTYCIASNSGKMGDWDEEKGYPNRRLLPVTPPRLLR